MYAVEFQTKITDGMIQVPEIFKKTINPHVRVILLAEDSIHTEEFSLESHDIIDELMASPLKINDFRPIKREDIYDRI